MAKPTDPKKHSYMFTDDIKFLQKAVVFHPENKKFLSLKRANDSFSRPNDWDLPGGNVLYGELHEKSLRNEIMEESNLDVGNFSPTQVITKYDKKTKIYLIFNGLYCKAKSDDVKISSEHAEFRWVTQKEFIKLNPSEFLINLINDVFKKILV